VTVQCEIDASANGRLRKAKVRFLDDDGKIIFSDSANLNEDKERLRVAKRAANRLETTPSNQHKKTNILFKLLDKKWIEIDTNHRKKAEEQRNAAASPQAQNQVLIMDAVEQTIRRPLCLIGDYAYAAAWLPIKNILGSGTGPDGQPVVYDPPQVRNETVLAIVRSDGQLFSAAALPGGKPLSDLKVGVELPHQPQSDRRWSGRGVKSFLAGERQKPGEVFERVVAVVDRFMDFDRSLAEQRHMCELVACYIFGTYLLDAFNVVGYLWPNGEKGTGKTNLLQVVCEVAYLGQVIMAGGSYASLRDLADYGACLAFDDAEGVMDVRKADPDKRALLLAGNRRGATVTVKELVDDKWILRHINTFCPRLFSAIRSPDDVLASRTIIVPLVRSNNAAKANINPLDCAKWPNDRHQLLDDLWAVGLLYLPRLRFFDGWIGEHAELTGRDLEPWRAILAVAVWLEEDHGCQGLYYRMRDLANNYQGERANLGENELVRILILALVEIVAKGPDLCLFTPKELANEMNRLATEEGITWKNKEGKEQDYTNSKSVGRLLARLRFTQATRTSRAKRRMVTRVEIEALARSYGVNLAEEMAEPATG